MNKEFITETVQIKKAVVLINDIENDRFLLLIQRIVSKLHSSHESSFKQEELEKLEKSLSLSTESIHLVIDILEFVFLQAAYELVKPAFLQASLLNIKLNEEKSNAIAEVWKEAGKDILEKIRQHKTISNQRLLTIKWRLNLNLATDCKTKQKNPTVLFQFNVGNASSSGQSVHVELDKDQLYELFSKIEQIQIQVDALNG